MHFIIIKGLKEFMVWKLNRQRIKRRIFATLVITHHCKVPKFSLFFPLKFFKREHKQLVRDTVLEFAKSTQIHSSLYISFLCINEVCYILIIYFILFYFLDGEKNGVKWEKSTNQWFTFFPP